MRAALCLAVACALSTACATAPRPVASCAEPAVAVVPRWMQPAPEAPAPEGVVASRTLFAEPWHRGTVRIQPEAERDPLAEAMGARGRRRIQAMNLREAPVADTLRMFAEMGGFNVVFSDDVPARTVTLSLRGVTLLGAFRTVLAAAHLGAESSDAAIVTVRPRVAEVATR